MTPSLIFPIDINTLNLNRRKFTTSEIIRDQGLKRIKKEKPLIPARMSTLMTYLTGVFVFSEKRTAACNAILTSSFNETRYYTFPFFDRHWTDPVSAFPPLWQGF